MSTLSCFQMEDDIIQMLQNEIGKEDVTFEQKKYYFEKMEEAAKRKECKDMEHKKMILTILKFGREALLLGCSVMVCLYIGRANISMPSYGRKHK